MPDAVRVERPWRARTAGLHTNALAASGRLGLCLIGTAVVLAVPLVCDRADETHLRALLSQALAGDGLAPHRPEGAPRR